MPIVFVSQLPRAYAIDTDLGPPVTHLEPVRHPLRGFEPSTMSAPVTAPGVEALETTQPAIERENSSDVYLATGEYYHEAIDLRIPGRLHDFIWKRKYRSRLGGDSPQGYGWCFSYDIRVEPRGEDLVLYNGDSRWDLFIKDPGSDTWTAPGHFTVITKESDESFLVTLQHYNFWALAPLSDPLIPGKITQVSERHGNIISFEYDAQGRLWKIRDTLNTPADNRVFTVNYNPEGYIASVTDFLGRKVEYAYYGQGETGGSPGDLKSVTTPPVTTTHNPNDRYDTFTYFETGDSLGYLESETVDYYGAATATTYTADAVGNMTSEIDPNGNTTTYTYNELNQITQQIGPTPLDYELLYYYDDNSNPTEITELDNSDLSSGNDETFLTTNEYDALNRLKATVDNAGNRNEHGYDSRSNTALYVDAEGIEILKVYDGLNRLTHIVRDMNSNAAVLADPDDIVITQVWDDSSRLIARIDGKGHDTRYAYDSLNRPNVKRMADGTLHQIGSGALWQVGLERPDLTAFLSGYDVHDNIIERRDANGSVIINQYDLLDRLTRCDIAPGPGVLFDTTWEEYQYDGLSRIVSASDDDSLVTRKYDSLSNVIEESFSVNGSPIKTVTAEFDGLSNLESSVYPGGREVTNYYDGLNRKRRVRDASISYLAQYWFIGPYRVEQRDYDNDVRTSFLYDVARNMVQSSHRKDNGTGAYVDARTFAWDAMFNKIRRTDEITDVTHTYAFDAAYRLVHTTVDDGAIPVPNIIRDTTWDIDHVQNWESVTGNPDPAAYIGAYTIDVMNQYVTTPFDERGYDYNGNLVLRTEPGGTPVIASMLYDFRNQMVEYDDAVTGERHEYLYDTFGRRIAKIVDADGIGQGPIETRYFYGGQNQWQIVEETGTLSLAIILRPTEILMAWTLWTMSWIVRAMPKAPSLRPSEKGSSNVASAAGAASGILVTVIKASEAGPDIARIYLAKKAQQAAIRGDWDEYDRLQRLMNGQGSSKSGNSGQSGSGSGSSGSGGSSGSSGSKSGSSGSDDGGSDSGSGSGEGGDSKCGS